MGHLGKITRGPRKELSLFRHKASVASNGEAGIQPSLVPDLEGKLYMPESSYNFFTPM